MTDFNKDDVLKVARELIELCNGHDSDFNEPRCDCCGVIKVIDGFDHTLDCPVLIAQDLLTRKYESDALAWTTKSECYNTDGNRVEVEPLINESDIKPWTAVPDLNTLGFRIDNKGKLRSVDDER